MRRRWRFGGRYWGRSTPTPLRATTTSPPTWRPWASTRRPSRGSRRRWPSGAVPAALAETDAELQRLNALLLPLLSTPKRDQAAQRRLEELSSQRQKVLTALAKAAAKRATGRVLSLERIQKQIRADAALVFW